jgi:3-dehydroquinate synthase
MQPETKRFHRPSVDNNGKQRVMITIEVRIENSSYPILIEDGLRNHVGRLMRQYVADATGVAVVTNPTVGRLYAESAVSSLSEAGFSPTVIEVKDGEQYKTLDTIKTLYNGLLSAGMDRKGAVLALGGGVVGDMTGFAAATYLRGIRFVQIPTTLLAMVDASVGGKTGVDLPEGKNLVGSFNQPQMVIIDPSVLATLHADELASGMAEVIKHGLIGNAAMFERLEKERPTDFRMLVDEAVRVKVAVVEHDPFENGERALLNLGHTFGHAFELLSNYEMKHGAAVGLGMVAAARLAVELRMCDTQLVERIKRVLLRQGLPIRTEGFTEEQVMDAMKHDKKKMKKKLRFAIPKGPGCCVLVEDPPREAVEAAVREVI